MTEGAQREPAWLTAMVDQHLALVADTLGDAMSGFSDFHVVMMSLTEPAEDADADERDRWERMCDRCGRYCPPGSDFFTGTVTRDLQGTQVIVAFGVCPACLARG